MRRRRVVFSSEAEADLTGLFEWIATASASPTTALRYVERLEAFCARLEVGSERGLRRDDVRLGLRVVGFERRTNVVFIVEADSVLILRIVHGGRNWEALFDA
ncbi:MAG: type II toxin-antitoxin system RelE/ParE family toxin [Pseudomonadota bacterium]